MIAELILAGVGLYIGGAVVAVYLMARFTDWNPEEPQVFFGVVFWPIALPLLLPVQIGIKSWKLGKEQRALAEQRR